MNNKIFELTDDFDFNNVKLENPSLITGNNYYSKITNITKNNLYIQLPKCNTKQGIINTNNKCFCDLEFFSNNKLVIEFFENLENHCVKEICSNKDLWFYDSTNISNDDIQEYVVPIMRSYKSGKKFLIKTSIKQDKIIIYDENEKKLTLEEYDKVNDIVPLININGIKFSKSSFIIDIILVQFMILYPSDSFENQILIKIDKPLNRVENNKINVINKKNNTINYDDSSSINDDDDEEEKSEEEEGEGEGEEEKREGEEEKREGEEVMREGEGEGEGEGEEEKGEKKEEEAEAEEEAENIVNNQDIVSINTNKNNKELFSTVSPDKSSYVYNTIKQDKSSSAIEIKELLVPHTLENNPVIEICDLDNIIINNEPIELKTHNAIYLEIYKKAKQKAKEIRKNAIQAFLEAKNIKIKYNLDSINDSSSDEEYK